MPPATSSLTVRKILPCRPAVAFKAWTEPKLFQQWFVPRPGMTVVAQMDLKVGGKYRISFNNPEKQKIIHVGGEFLVIEVPRRLEYTWIFEKESFPEWTDRTIVKVAFNALDQDRTEIVLTHELFSDPEECQSHTEGWTAILDRMAEGISNP